MSAGCPVCGGSTRPAGQRRGSLDARTYALRHCPSCRFSFVENPRTDYEAIYSEAYYRGEGADPLVDYAHERDHPQTTIRHYEWRGIGRIVGSLIAPTPSTRWLDFGCGMGGLVDHCRRVLGVDATGHEDGWAARHLRERGLPMLTGDQLAAQEGSFDVVTAIEVIEHVPDPVEVLRSIRRLLRPGGLLFLTTGNARPHRGRIDRWAYVIPEIHVSFFEPSTVATALERAGFRPRFPGYAPGFTDVIRFKMLKNLKVQDRSRLEAAVPWPLLCRLVDRRYGISAHPVGWAT